MALKLMYITNDPTVALIAQANGVDRIWVDLEVNGKAQRQKNMDTVKSHHTVEDVGRLSRVLTTSELMVRINPWNENSVQEIDAVIAAGAQRIMLPMWTSAAETDAFLAAVNARAATTLLLETKQAVQCLDAVLENPAVEEIHIGLNDLHLSYGLTFMFQLLSDGTVEQLCRRIAERGIPYGFGGVARPGEGLLPAEMILHEHVRLNSSMVILSRSFCNVSSCSSPDEVAEIFRTNTALLRSHEAHIRTLPQSVLLDNKQRVLQVVTDIVNKSVPR